MLPDKTLLTRVSGCLEISQDLVKLFIYFLQNVRKTRLHFFWAITK